MWRMKKNNAGFSLLEMLLVLAIASSMIIMFLNFTTQKSDQLRRDRTVLQIQQVLNAGLAYYVANGHWPKCYNQISGSDLENTYIPNVVTSYGGNVIGMGNYVSGGTCGATGGNGPVFYVSTEIGNGAATAKNMVDAKIIAGMLPMGYTTAYTNWDSMMTGASSTVPAVACTLGSSCRVIASVTIPGQNLNNARSVNFAGIYHSGACVPAPTCPSGMSPAIYAVPTGISGVNDSPQCSGATGFRTCTGVPLYSVSSFKAYARGGASGTDNTTGDTSSPSASPLDCRVVNTPAAFPCSSQYSSVNSSDPAGQTYWRVCLAIVTEKGLINVNSIGGNISSPASPWGYEQGKMMGSILAITRCIPSGGDVPSGSPFTVWTPNQATLP